MRKAHRPQSIEWSEYKTMRQYQSIGEVLDEFRAFGYRTGVENILSNNGRKGKGGNGHNWLTVEEG